MKLRVLRTDRYRSLRDVEIEFGDLNLFIGANASGKSTILDALRFLSEGVRNHDFGPPVKQRGGIAHIAWKGADAGPVGLTVGMQGGNSRYEWSLRLVGSAERFYVEEQVKLVQDGAPPAELLRAERGRGWWRSGQQGSVTLEQPPTACVLAAAAADASFPARDMARFVGRWGFFDPNPFLLRRDWQGIGADGLDSHGRNLAETLHALDKDTLNRVIGATRAIVGLPERIERRKSEDEGRFYFAQSEPGLRHKVHQMSVSSGTLRVLALATALVADPEAKLIGIEEPENNMHPATLLALAEQIQCIRDRVQVAVTTHSSLLLGYLDDPGAVRVVRRDGTRGTRVVSDNPAAVRRALQESGFNLGEYYETTGFGSS